MNAKSLTEANGRGASLEVDGYAFEKLRETLSQRLFGAVQFNAQERGSVNSPPTF